MKILIIMLLFCFGAYGQQDLVLASIQQADVSCTPDANEQNTTASVTSDDYCNESDNISNWLNSGADAVTISLESSDTDTGLYAVKLVSDAGGTEFSYLSFPGLSGQATTIKLRFKQTVGSNASFLAAGTSPTGSTAITDEWTEHEFETTPSGTVILRLYPAGPTGNGDPEDAVLVSLVSVISPSS